MRVPISNRSCRLISLALGSRGTVLLKRNPPTVKEEPSDDNTSWEHTSPTVYITARFARTVPSTRDDTPSPVMSEARELQDRGHFPSLYGVDAHGRSAYHHSDGPPSTEGECDGRSHSEHPRGSPCAGCRSATARGRGARGAVPFLFCAADIHFDVGNDSTVRAPAVRLGRAGVRIRLKTGGVSIQ